MTDKIISICLEPETVQQLDRVTQALGYSRSRFVEACVLKVLGLPVFKKAVSKIEAIKADDLEASLKAEASS